VFAVMWLVGGYHKSVSRARVHVLKNTKSNVSAKSGGANIFLFFPLPLRGLLRGYLACEIASYLLALSNLIIGLKDFEGIL